MRKRPFISFVATFLTVCVGCSDSEPVTTDDRTNPMRVDENDSNRQPSPEANRKLETIAAALKSLLKRTNDDSFVICSHNSKEYVQFAMDEQGLLLDLPTIPLDDEQRKRAITFFNSMGVSLQDSEMLDEPGGQVVGRMQMFQVKLEHGADRGARLVLDVFEQVYDLPIDFALVIEEN